MVRAVVAMLCAGAAYAQVMVIGVDGLGSFALREGAPVNFQRAMEQGAWTLKARGVLPTVSSPNWAAMIMGAGPERTGVLSNDWEPKKPELPAQCDERDGRFPTVFRVVHEQRPRSFIAVVHDWQGFGRLVEPGVAGVVKHVKGSAAAAEEAKRIWKEQKPDLLFVHFDDVDHAGHDHGFGSEAYRAALEKVDRWIGELREAAGEAHVLITADHGGTGTKHGHPSMRDLEIPWIVTGPKVKRGHEVKSPVSTTDTAAMVVRLLAVRPHPCWTGRAIEEALR